jgi:DNA modification methylase
MKLNTIIHGNCLEKLKELADNSIDGVVTDPPYELGFMGKKWDNTGIAYNVELWKEALRVLKPGGHLLSFGGSRTYHRMASAIEDAGFEIRDQIAWCYGQGFPKSLNISLQIKKKYNIGLCTCNVFEPMLELGYENSNNKRDNISNGEDDRLGSGKQIQHKRDDNNEMEEQIKDTNLSPDNAFRKESRVCELSEKDNKKEQGFEKVSESILQSKVCKPISEKERLGNTTLRSGLEENKTTGEREGQSMSDMQNETTDGIAGSSLNTIQNGRKEHDGEFSGSLSQLPQQDRENNRKRVEQIKNDCNSEEWNNLSRFICSKCYCLKKDIGGTALKPSIEPICMARKPLSEKSVAENVLRWGTGGINIDGSRIQHNEETKTTNRKQRSAGWSPDNCGFDSTKNIVASASPFGRFPANLIHDGSQEVMDLFPETDSRSAARFFYCAKASRSERDYGLDNFDGKQKIYRATANGTGEISKNMERFASIMKNNHPTVKPIKLMQYLIKLVTPPGGIVLDPFAGSGSTLIAAKLLGFKYVGIEMDKEYIKIAEARLKAYEGGKSA